MSGVGRNVVANLAGRAWAALMSFAFVPLYLRLLGIEAYGLIGFFASLMVVFTVLDLGLGITVNRGLARESASGAIGESARNFFATIGAIYWAMAVAIGAAVALLAPVIVRDWLNPATLDPAEAVLAVRAMGLTAMLRWPTALYVGALMGLQRQVQLNIITAAFATAAGAGAVVVLTLVERSVTAYFLWQAAVAGAQILFLRRVAWRGLALPGHRPKVAFAHLRDSLGFSAGMTGVALLSVVLVQSDKLLLARLLPLDAFGHYALAAAVAGVLTVAGSAIESATFPALARVVVLRDEEGERRLYHDVSQASALLIVPVTMAVVLFADELLRAYLGDPRLAAQTRRLLATLAAGNGILAMMMLPLSLQLAHGWTRLSLYKNVVAVMLFVPLLYLLVTTFGAIGAAFTWLALTVGYLLIEVPIMHRRLLRGDAARWFAHDLGVPFGASLVCLGGLRLILSPDAPLPVALVAIGASVLLAQVGGAVLLPTPRRVLRERLARFQHQPS